MARKSAGDVRLTWPRRGEHVLRDEATGSLSFTDGGLPPYRLVEDFCVGSEESVPFDPAKSNLLVKGENLFALLGLLPHYRSKVDLVYVDPPFNTGSGFPEYFDDFEHDAYLSMMEIRLSLAAELLRPGGILAVHTDREEQPYVRVLLDELLGREHLISQISWQRGPDRTLLGQGSSLVNDCVEYIAVYSNGPLRGDLSIPVKQEPLSVKTLESYSRILEFSEERSLVEEFQQSGAPVRIYAHASYTFRPAGAVNMRRAAEGAWARFPRVFPKLARLTNQQEESTFQRSLIRKMPEKDVLYSVDYVQSRGKYKGPRRRYHLNGQVVLFLKDISRLEGDKAVRVADLNNFWSHEEVPTTGIAGEGGVVLKRGKKPEALLHRIIGAFSKEGELVLDFFSGSGTTGAVAHKMGRRFIMVDAGEKPAEMGLQRMTRVIRGEDPGGVSGICGFRGGGGFRVWSVHVNKRQGPLPLPLEPT